jgi:hypothetical protein
LQHHVAVATFALDAGRSMLRVAEENEVGRFVDAARRNLSDGHIDVADLALRQGGEAGQIPANGVPVA